AVEAAALRGGDLEGAGEGLKSQRGKFAFVGKRWCAVIGGELVVWIGNVGR
ncbi:hypothetical protein Tco_1453856, partial [Tanacetum coccineum]